FCQAQKAVGFTRHGRRNDDNLVAGRMPLGYATRHVLDALDRAHRRATVFMNNYGHLLLCLMGWTDKTGYFSVFLQCRQPVHPADVPYPARLCHRVDKYPAPDAAYPYFAMLDAHVPVVAQRMQAAHLAHHVL